MLYGLIEFRDQNLELRRTNTGGGVSHSLRHSEDKNRYSTRAYHRFNLVPLTWIINGDRTKITKLIIYTLKTFLRQSAYSNRIATDGLVSKHLLSPFLVVYYDNPCRFA